MGLFILYIQQRFYIENSAITIKAYTKCDNMIKNVTFTDSTSAQVALYSN